MRLTKKKYKALAKKYKISTMNFELLLNKLFDTKDIQYLIKEPNLTLRQYIKLRRYINKVYVKHYPLAYLLESQPFWKHTFYINEDVLIPRTDTEILIETTLKKISNKTSAMSILDIGVGSGCILLSLLDEYKKAQGVGVDISKKALQVAKKNATDMELTDRTLLLESDMLKNLGNQYKFDLIVSNPPYIDMKDPNVTASVANHEPHSALFAYYKGLYYYHYIFMNIKDYIHKKSVILLEIGFSQEPAVRYIALQYGFYIYHVHRDSADNPRVIEVRMK